MKTVTSLYFLCAFILLIEMTISSSNARDLKQVSSSMSLLKDLELDKNTKLRLLILVYDMLESNNNDHERTALLNAHAHKKSKNTRF